MKMGLQTEDWALGAERHILVWHRGGWDRGAAGRMDGANKAVSVILLSCKCLHHVTYLLTFAQSPCTLAYICVHIDVNLLLCMDLYLYETVILFPCRPCVQLSTAPTKTQ